MRQPERFAGKYMALRPDFRIETTDFLVFLEAKAGSRKALSRIWRMPKEVTYYEFLTDCTKPTQRGFYFIVPLDSLEPCLRSLTEQFRSTDCLHTGAIVWENFSICMECGSISRLPLRNEFAPPRR